MKRKATTQIQKKATTTTLAKKAPAGRPQLRGAAKPQAKPQIKKQIKAPVKEVESEEDDDDVDDESASSGEDIGDIDEYLQGEDTVETNNVDFDENYDDGEVVLNPKKKQMLFDSDDEEAEDIGTSKKFSDDNTKWLKAAGDNADVDSEEDEIDERLAKKAAKIAAKKKALEDEIKDADEDFKAQIKAQQEEEEEEDSDEEEQEDLEDIANRMENLHGKIQAAVGILSDFKERRPKGVSREEFVQKLKLDLMSYFGYTEFLMDLYFNLFTPAEALSHMESNEVARPLTIRVNTLKAVRKDLAQALINKGVTLKPIKWSKVGLVIYESKIPIGATPEYLGGQYMLQSAASFLPVLALDPQPNEQVLDMCAAPGGKTTYIASLMKNTGVLHANDKHPDRIHALVANAHRMGVRNCVVSNMDGCAIPSLGARFDRVLVDAPCMGLGVIAKDRSIKSSKEERDMITCIDIQIKLLLAAIDVCDISKAAIIVYSTCSISVEENEAIVNKALQKRFVKVVETGLEFGKEGITSYRGKEFHPSIKMSRRYYPHAHNIDGFYVCKLQKFANGVRLSKTAGDGIPLERVAEAIVDKKKTTKDKSAPIKFNDDEHHVFDKEKEKEKTQKNKDKKSRKKQARMARMKVNADSGDNDVSMESIDDVIPAQNSKPASNGSAQKKLRGSKQ